MIHLSPPFHFDRSLPSKRTIASDGGPLSFPGVTTAGSGQTMPDLYARGSWAPAGPRSRRTAATLAAPAIVQRKRVRRAFMRMRACGRRGDGRVIIGDEEGGVKIQTAKR